MHGRLLAAGSRLVVVAALALVPPAAAAADTPATTSTVTTSAPVTAGAGTTPTTYTVTTTSDSGGCDESSCSLRGALAVARDGDTIRLPALDGPYTQQRGPFVVDRSVKIVGDGADRTLVTGDTGRVFEVRVREGGAVPTVEISHLRMAYGHMYGEGGGNVYNDGVLTLDHVRVSGGTAWWGGGIANRNRLTVKHSLIDANTASYPEPVAQGGGIYSESDAEDALVVSDSTLTGNTATYAGGGIAVRAADQARSLSSARLVRVTLARNRTFNGGPGGLFVDPGALVSVTGSILAENVISEQDKRRAVADTPSNCEPKAPPVDGGGNLADTPDCGFPTGDPQLSGKLVSGLGETPLLTLAPGSPAIDRAGACEGTDQRDLVRPQGAACDAGAFEFAAPVIEQGPPEQTTDTSATFTFSYSPPPNAFECRLDSSGAAGEWKPCSSPWTYVDLAPGAYTFRVRVPGDSAEANRSFSVVAPVPTIDAGPSGQITGTATTFAFSSAAPDATFECRLDGPSGAGTFAPCTSPKAYSALAPGDYLFVVRAAGTTAQASRVFSVAAPPPPVLTAAPRQVAPSPTPAPVAAPTPTYRRSVVVKPTKGTVKVRLPGTRRYVDLDTIDSVPLGASIDVRKGRVRLYAARDASGRTQAASFYGGVFRIVQRGRVIELQLRGPKPRCGSGSATASAASKPRKRKHKRRTRRLWGSGKGKFRTSGKYSAATVRGTKWLVEDSCRSTTTRVVRGVVSVRDFKRKRTIILRAGDRYVARRVR
jgi:hypothetical protein